MRYINATLNCSKAATDVFFFWETPKNPETSLIQFSCFCTGICLRFTVHLWLFGLFEINFILNRSFEAGKLVSRVSSSWNPVRRKLICQDKLVSPPRTLQFQITLMTQIKEQETALVVTAWHAQSGLRKLETGKLICRQQSLAQSVAR